METSVSSKLRAFFQSHSAVYLYGTGEFAGRYLEILSQMRQKIAGCIVSGKHDGDFYGYRVWSLQEIQGNLSADAGVIIAVSETHQEEIHDYLRQLGCAVPTFALDNQAFSMLHDEQALVEHLREMTIPCHKVFPPLRSLHKILVIRLDVIGDFLMTIPFLRELKRNVPQAEIDVVLRRSNEFLLKDCPYVHRVIPFDTNQKEYVDVPHIRNFLEEHAIDDAYEALFLPCVILQGRNYQETYAMTMLTGIKYRVGRITSFGSDGVESPWQKTRFELLEPLFTKLVWQSDARHEVQYMLELVEVCGGRVANDRMEYWISPENRAFAERTVVLTPGWRTIACGLVGSEKARSWSPEKYRELIARSAGKNARFVLLGGEDAREAAACIGAGENIIDLTGATTLPQVAAVMDCCDLYMGSDTGLMHFAVATGTPVVELSVWLRDGVPTNCSAPARMGPWGVPSRILIPESGLDGCHGRCSKTYAHCINTITVEQVEQAMEELLADA